MSTQIEKQNFALNEHVLKGSKVKVLEINLDNELKRKFEQIGLNLNEIIEVHDDKLKDITIFKINNVKYAIRSNIAKNIIVKKEN